jgi:N-acyl-phosphatidylethanolamine-hydrolysing phospholipase D
LKHVSFTHSKSARQRAVRWLGVVFWLAAELGVACRPAAAEVVVGPHHRGGRFTNPGHGAHRLPSLAVTVPFFVRRAIASFRPPFEHAAERVANDGAFLRENAEHSVPTVTWIGHSTLLVQMGGVTFLTDPIWSKYASPIPVGPRRLVDPGVSIDDLPPIDFVVISHNHYDHMDTPTLARLAERARRRGEETVFFVPLANGAILERAGVGRVVEMDWWESTEHEGVRIHCVPARHWSRRGLLDGDRALWSGWVVVAAERRFYFAGDTGMFDGFATLGERLGPFDLAALPIGAYEPAAMMSQAHLNPEEAVTAAVDLGARSTVAVHYGTFVLSDEPVDAPPERFARASERAGRGQQVDWLLTIGQTRAW